MTGALKREWTADEIARQRANLDYWLTTVSILALAASGALKGNGQ